MTTGQVAQELNVTVPRVRQLVKAGQLSPRTEETLRGPVLCFKRDEVEAFKEARAELERQRAEAGGKGRPLKGTGIERTGQPRRRRPSN